MLLYFILVSVLSFAAANERKIVCYHGTWSTYRTGLGKFDVTDINPHLCTHLIYTFVGIDDHGQVISLDPSLDLPDGKDTFRKFNALKNINSNLKTILAVGGWNEGSAKYSTMAANATSRANFVKSALNMVLTYGFDGFDLDWEYPARRDTTHGAEDVDNFTKLIKELRVQFDKYGLLLSAAVSPTGATASQSYDIPSISKYLDFIHVMTYDMYGPWESVVNHNSPLHRGEGQENVAREDFNSADVSLDYWLSQGCPPEKLLMGVPFYGHTFTLANVSQNSVGAPSAGAGFAGPYTQENGTIGYNEFCSMLHTQSWDVRFDAKAKVPYAVKENSWVSYDDVDSMTKKVEYAISRNIGGVMIWSIETDDFHGICGEKFPLLTAINRVMGKVNQTSATVTNVPPVSSSTISTTAKPTVSSSTASATSKPSSSSTVSTAAPATGKIVCYHGTWSTYRTGLGKFDVTDINPHLCTHLIYTFVGINDHGQVISLDPWVDLPDGKDTFRKFNALKNINSNLKTILAVGGWNEGSAKYSTMAANATSRANFVKSALNMVLTYGFDGFDLDWEYPARRDTTHGAEDVDNFTKLIKELRVQFDKYGLLLSAAVSPTGATASQSYDIPSISKYLDFIHVMTYDMYGPWESVVNHNSPLHRGEGQENVAREDFNSADVSLDYWLSQGCPPEKLLMGVPFYGHTFTLANVSQNSVGAPSAGAGFAGPYTQENGTIGYNEFCSMLHTQSWDVRFDAKAKVPYAVKENSWVSYDDVDSMTKKVEYAISRNIGGVMIWSIETDDFHGICGEKFPLLTAINRVMGKVNQTSATVTNVPPVSSSTISTTAKPTVSSSTASATSKPSSSSTVSTAAPATGICSKLGPTRNPIDCSTYYMCAYDRAGNISPVLMKCPKYTYWDQQNLYCNYLHETDCKV